MTQHENKQIDLLNAKIDRVLSYMENDEATGTKGLVARAAILEKKVGKIETDEKVKRGKTTVFVLIGSAFISFLGWLFK